jgi:hypothetical protein
MNFMLQHHVFRPSLPAVQSQNPRCRPCYSCGFAQSRLTNLTKIRALYLQSHSRTRSVDLEKPTPSASGKTLVVASTRGNAVTSAMVDGKPVTIGLNAYIKP